MSTIAAFLKNENLTRIQQNGKPVGYYHPFLVVFSIWMDKKGIYSHHNDAKSKNKDLDIKKLSLREEQLRKVRGVLFSKLDTHIGGR